MRALVPMYLSVTSFMHDRAQKVRERRESGQNTLEYAGIAILIAIALVIILTQARGPLEALANRFVAAVTAVLEATG